MGQPLGPLRIKAPLTLGGGGGSLPIKERVPPWQTPEDDGGSSQWKVDGQEFPTLGTQKTARKVIGSADPDDTNMGRRPSGHPIPVSRVLDGRCDRRRTFGQFGKGTAMFGCGVSRNP